ncbi:MAG TPA: hypothetical protein VFK69_07410, partial [Candidatus Eisenbacteria bacterium]|nr:hypothetical protein [Candidatus Eisenbacteria bacterium]
MRRPRWIPRLLRPPLPRPLDLLRLFVIALCALAACASRARALEIDVPAGNADLQDAIDKLAASNDADNFLYISQSSFDWNTTITLAAFQFTNGHRLLIAPEPGVGIARAQIVNADPHNAILAANQVGGVVIRDVDLLRSVTNLSELMDLSMVDDFTIERCHIGYTSASIGDPGKNMVEILYPTHLVIRNCMLFSVMPGAFADVIHASPFGDPQNSLYLYNDDISDYHEAGIRLDGSGPESSLVVMRNCVAFNSPALGTEPVAYSSGGGTHNFRVRSSHNTAFASVGHIEAIDAGGIDVAGASLPDFLQLPPTAPEEDGDVITRSWDFTPGAVNHDFYHLIATAGLHTPATRRGVTVLDGSPTPLDEAVRDDIDDQLRPSLGSDPHTDRGADQLDSETASAAAVPAAPARALWAAPARNPAPGLALAWRSDAEG